MLTPQEVSSHAFTKAVMGGYNMTMVDEFLDEVTDDYTALYKENAALKAKLKVLVEKVEEYRATEDSMRATLLTAQRMADSIIQEAEEKRDTILRQAEDAAREQLDGFRQEAERYDKRLRQGQEEIQRFVAETRALCEKELKFLEEFPVLPPVEEEPAGMTEEIEETILSAAEAAAPPIPEPEPEPEPAVVEAAHQAAPAPSAEKLLDTLAAAEELRDDDLSATRRVNINELKFGPNYRSEAD